MHVVIRDTGDTGYLIKKVTPHKRPWKTILTFFAIISCEVIISVVVFVCGTRYILTQSGGGNIVAGVLAMVFINDIDNAGSFNFYLFFNFYSIFLF